MNIDAMKRDIERFEKLSVEHAQEYRQPSAAKGNAKNRALIKLVEKWTSTSDAVPALRQLIRHESVAVRLMAAAFLIKFDKDPQAVAQLRQISKYDPGLLAISARVLLSFYEVPREE